MNSRVIPLGNNHSPSVAVNGMLNRAHDAIGCPQPLSCVQGPRRVLKTPAGVFCVPPPLSSCPHCPDHPSISGKESSFPPWPWGLGEGSHSGVLVQQCAHWSVLQSVGAGGWPAAPRKGPWRWPFPVRAFHTWGSQGPGRSSDLSEGTNLSVAHHISVLAPRSGCWFWGL